MVSFGRLRSDNVLLSLCSDAAILRDPGLNSDDLPHSLISQSQSAMAPKSNYMIGQI